jgi:penicillin amidase
MARIRRLVLITLIIIILLIVLLAIVAYINIRRAYPQTEGAIQLPGLHAPVEVYRDSFGIPHIYAANTHDLFMAQGFIHAQDRFWQMEFWRRIGTGRLSEILGESALENDKFIRTLGWHRTAAQEVALLSPEALAAMEAYAEGVNAYLSTNTKSMGFEFTVLGLTGVDIDPEPWTVVHTLAWAKVMAWDLGGNRGMELLRANVAARLGVNAVEEIVPAYNSSYPVIVPELLTNATLDSIPDMAYESHALGEGFGLGSNNWVIAGERTESGTPLLANDPHLGIQMPSIWYEIGLHCDPIGPECPFNVVGASFASAPGVIIGHNDQIAWGVTNLGPDVQDLFIERINPENPNQYEFQGEWLDMDIIKEEINISGEDEPVMLNVRITKHGPIINDVAGGTEDEWYYGWQPLALSWTALKPSMLMESVLMLDQAQNWEDFRNALRYWAVPSQNFVYADVDGNIGYQAPGQIPIRANGDGSIPVPGWTGEYEWLDFIPFEELPYSFNPEKGYIATANHAVVGEEYPYTITVDWAPGFRARRIVEMIESDDSITIEDIQAMQGDNHQIYVDDVLTYILELQPTDSRLAQAVDLLREWDGQTVRDSAAAALFETVRIHLIDEIYQDELGERLMQKARPSLLTALVNILPNADAVWYDDVNTEEIETREVILLNALEAAVDELTETLGKSMSKWRWGDLHTATFENQSLGQSGIGLIEWIFNRGPVAVDGSFFTVNNTGYDWNESYDVAVVPSYRQIIDPANFSRSLSIHTTGQSGHTFHPHYDDMIDMWRNIEYHPMLWVKQDIIAASEGHLTLKPGDS